MIFTILQIKLYEIEHFKKIGYKNLKKGFAIHLIVLNLPSHLKRNACSLYIECESSSGVEHHLAKVRVAGSNPVFRSENIPIWMPNGRQARVVELVDTLDLKSSGQ